MSLGTVKPDWIGGHALFSSIPGKLKRLGEKFSLCTQTGVGGGRRLCGEEKGWGESEQRMVFLTVH